VAGAAMAMNAQNGVLGGGAAADNVVNEAAMAAEAALLEDRRIVRFDHDRFMEVLERESPGMVVPVLRFRKVLRNECVRQVTVHAYRSRMVRPVLPGGELVIHDVAICTRTRVGGEVTQPFTVIKRKEPDAQYKTHKACKHGPHFKKYRENRGLTH
jgi:hypothetical protein